MRRAARAGVVLLVVFALQPGCVIRWLTTPPPSSEPGPAPEAPDYAEPATWSARPDAVDRADDAPPDWPAIDPSAAPADVFYVHPTSFVGRRWNGPVDDASLNDATDRVATGIQASAFNACCTVWAPRYRQASAVAFYEPSPAGEAAIALAYQDVARAFDVFLDHTGDRPFLLAGHSQGSVLAEQLLVDRIVGTPLMDRLVVAVLPGGRVTTDGLAAHGLRACAHPQDVGCVVAWNARSPDYVPSRFEHAVDPAARLCSNPLSWRDDGLAVPASANRGAVFLDHGPDVFPAFADAQCVDGTLVVREIGRAPRSLPSRILDRMLGVGNYHAYEVQLFWVDLRVNAGERVRAFQAGGAPR